VFAPILKNDEALHPVPKGSVIFDHSSASQLSAVNYLETWRRALIFHYITSASQSENATLIAGVALEID